MIETTSSSPASLPVALVTGASRGLGAAMAEMIAARGYHVVAVARTVGALEELDDRIKATGKGQATLAPMDINNEDAMAHLCRSIYDRWGSLDLWVHSAVHAAPLTPATSIPGKDFDRSVDLNLRALSRLIPFVDPLLRAGETPGQAVFFDDTWNDKFFSTYGATKAAQRVMVESYRNESTSPRSARVTILTPPPMGTALRARFYPGEDRSTLAKPLDVAKEMLPKILP